MRLGALNLASAAALASVIATSAVTTAFPGQKFASQANVTIARARTTATNLVPGKIVSEELERETGGSGLRYTFDIRTPRGIREVGIDAKSGRVLENNAEASRPERVRRRLQRVR